GDLQRRRCIEIDPAQPVPPFRLWQGQIVAKPDIDGQLLAGMKGILCIAGPGEVLGGKEIRNFVLPPIAPASDQHIRQSVTAGPIPITALRCAAWTEGKESVGSAGLPGVETVHAKFAAELQLVAPLYVGERCEQIVRFLALTEEGPRGSSNGGGVVAGIRGEFITIGNNCRK